MLHELLYSKYLRLRYLTKSVKYNSYHAIRVNKTKTQQSIKISGAKIWNDQPREWNKCLKLGFKVFVERVKKILYTIWSKFILLTHNCTVSKM